MQRKINGITYKVSDNTAIETRSYGEITDEIAARLTTIAEESTYGR